MMLFTSNLGLEGGYPLILFVISLVCILLSIGLVLVYDKSKYDNTVLAQLRIIMILNIMFNIIFGSFFSLLLMWGILASIGTW